MPIFQEHQELRSGPPESQGPECSDPIPIRPPAEVTLFRRLSEESIRTDLCDGPILDDAVSAISDRDHVATATNTVSDRAELIERLKRGESPTWIPNRHLESLFQQDSPRSPTATPRQQAPTSPTLLPPADITPEKLDRSKDDLANQERLQEGLEIERPRSALHSGDFTEDVSRRKDSQRSGLGTGVQEGSGPYGYQWLPSSPPRNFTPFPSERRRVSDWRSESATSSLSSSLSQSFVYKLPTSPLVQSESNDELDLALPINSINLAVDSKPGAVDRRHTVNLSRSSPFASPAALDRRSSLRKEGSLPYQAHQPRRSLNSTPNILFPSSSPQSPSPFLRSRRPSYSSDASPLQHASMVGSYEESILRGRMSTNPSKPLDFLAQIGVLGFGKCKASLRCPAHVTLPFSAVFYSYANTSHGRSKGDDGPSPYVGLIDLENGLPNSEDELRARRKLQSRYADRRMDDDEMDVDCGLPDGPEEDQTKGATRQKKRSKSPRAPPGGRYRIPEKGQLQIIIKNQNKTAVKLYLVPYDLSGMEPGTKTFIRQRSYSSGAVIDNVPELKDPGTADHPVLRYLIHLHICCPSKGRYYLYKSIRVVFANRVPDGKEKLHNEITYPEPRFSPYKPVRVMRPSVSAQLSGPAAMLSAEKAFRRRSSGFTFSSHQPHQPHAQPNFDPRSVAEISTPSRPSSTFLASVFGSDGGGSGISGRYNDNHTVEPIPCKLFPRGNRQPSTVSSASDLTTTTTTTAELGIYSRMATSDVTGRPSSSASQAVNEADWGTNVSGLDSGRYGKLSRGDVGYGGNAFANQPDGNLGAAEGLLSQRLRSLGVQSQSRAADTELSGGDGTQV
ncbi:hypothetical protein VTK73DRAFT_10402 [Phialemonium thermophilum]|uniref:Atos-like conserved domain-containing protein n=1 Tax=Phialemonium thermophilum TaxID=223376 RepID=A0ABR3XG69_9PEZI